MRRAGLFAVLLLVLPPLAAAGVTARLEPDLSGPSMVDAGTPTPFTGFLYAYANAEGTWVRSRAFVAAVPVEIVDEAGKVVGRGSTNLLGAYSIPVTLATRGEHELVARVHRGAATEGRSAPLDVRAGERPSIPTAFSAVETEPNRVNVTWGPPVDDGGLDRIKYRLYRGDNGQPLAPFANLDPALVGYSLNFSIPPNTDVALDLRAYNGLGEGPGASEVLLRKVYPNVEVEITHFRVCRDGGGCVDVPPGGGADVWTGRYTYAAHFDGSATREGYSWANVSWRADIHDTFYGDTFTSSRSGKTTANGTFASASHAQVMHIQSGCNMGAAVPHDFRVEATVDLRTASDDAFFVWKVRAAMC